ncbi:MAG: xanthine phosphoribosyltransferase [Acidimicrobiia bacterium]
MIDPSSSGAVLLRAALLDRGRVEDSLLKVDDFLNHRVEPSLLTAIGETLATAFAEASPELVLTAEASGIPPAMTTSAALGIPFVYAKKYPRSDAVRPAYVRAVSSPTKGVEYSVEVARKVLPQGCRVLVVDDFLSRGRTAEALGEIVLEAEAELVGLGFVVEKSFMEGRARLETHGWRVESVAIVSSLEDGVVSVLD